VSNLVVSIALVAIGAICGLLSSLFMSATQQRNSITLKLLDGYFEVRKSIVDAVSELTSLNLTDEFDWPTRAKFRDRISKLYYMHYDFLPKIVLDSLILLNMTLENPHDGLFTVSGDVVVPMADTEIVEFVEHCSVFQNSAFMALIALKSKNPTTRANQAVRLHARHVLNTLNRLSSAEDLLVLAKQFKKIARA